MSPKPAPRARPAPPLQLQLHLHTDIGVHGSAGLLLPLRGRAAGLAALVAIEPGISRQRAAALLWPDADTPRNNLRQQLLRFKQALGRSLIDGEDELRLAAAVVLAAAPAGAELLAGHPLADDDFGDWLREQRAAARRGVAEAARAALAQAEAAQDAEAGAAAAQRWLAAEPDAEAPRRELMRMHYLRGDSAAGLRTYDELRRMLAAEHGLRPSADTERVAAALRQSGPGTTLAPHAPRTVAPVLLRPPRMVGREAERRAVHAAWASQRAVFVLGEAGLGKSRLLAECVPAGDGLLVGARPGDAAVPFATLARLLRLLLPRVGSMAAVAEGRELARVLPELQPAVPMPADGRKLQLQHAVSELLAQAAPAVIALDDLHFADDASLDMLLSALGAQGAGAAAAPHGTRWLFARRPAEGSAALARLTDALEETRAAVCVPLAPLSTAEMAELIDSLGLDDLDGQAMAAELVRHTGGNPLFALETLKVRWLQGPGAGGMPRPASVGALIEKRLRQLSPEALALARVAAVAGVDFDIEVAERLLGCSALALADRWAELEAAQVLRDNAFAHDLVFEATLRTLPRPVACKLHGDLAALLEARGSEPARVAEHWRASGSSLRAVPHLVDAAERALGRYQVATAGDHFMAAAEALQQAGQRAEAFSMLRRCAEAWADFADVPRTQALQRHMQALASSADDLTQLALVEARLHDLAGRYDLALAVAREAVAHAERSGDRESLATGLTYAYEALWWRGETEEALNTAQRVREIWAALGRAREVANADYTIAVAEHGRGRFDLAEAAHERSAPWIMAHGDGAMVAHHLRERGMLHLDLGRFEAAEQSMSAALQWLARAEAGSDLWRACLARLATVLRHRGRYARALALLDEYEHRCAEAPRASAWWDAGIERGLLMLAMGRADLALQALHALPSSDDDAQVKTVRQHMLACALVQAGAMPRGELGSCAPPSEARMAVAFARVHARLLPVAERSAELAALATAADRLGMVAEALGIRVEQLQSLVDIGHLDEAQPLAERVAAGLAERQPLVHQPLAWWALHGAWSAHDPARARAALDHAVGWLAEALDHHVPPAFRYGVMQRHPVNRAVLAAAAALPEWAPRLRRWQAAAEVGT